MILKDSTHEPNTKYGNGAIFQILQTLDEDSTIFASYVKFSAIHLLHSFIKIVITIKDLQ